MITKTLSFFTTRGSSGTRGIQESFTRNSDRIGDTIETRAKNGGAKARQEDGTISGTKKIRNLKFLAIIAELKIKN